MPDANRLYIGEGVTIKGEISVPDTLVVCGSLEGDVSVGNLVVGETGTIKGRITVAENAEISGKVFEKLEVRVPLDPALDRPGRRQYQLRPAADRTRRKHRRRALLHRVPSGAEARKGRYLSQAGSEGCQAGRFQAYEAAEPDRFGTVADASCPSHNLSCK